MKLRTKDFIASEDGAVTVDWVVLTAAIVGLGVIVITTIGKATTNMSTGVNAHLMSQDVTTTY
jgi:Flp pilus assembly pilin Flp